MVESFIHRPTLSLVISLIITLLGVLALTQLPVTQFPDIVPPSVTVTANYTGANAEVSSKAVVTTIERAINGVPGMTYMTSVSGNDGKSIIQVNFRVGTDPDLAAVNVQNRVSTVLDELPTEVVRAGVVAEKEVNSMLLYLNVTADSPEMDEKFIYNFADINIVPELKRIDGVGFADLMGAREYSMRVWLKPDRMAVYKVSAEEIVKALRAQNIEAAPGKAGESSSRHEQVLQYVFRYTGKFYEPAQYENLVIRANDDGAMLRLKDVAEVEFGAMSYEVLSKIDGKPSAAIMLKQRPGSNASDVIKNVKQRMEELRETFPPGVTYEVSYDVSRFLEASIHEVLRTLLEAFILVSVVVFLFLQDFRSTLIPALAVPVSLIGTFFFLQLLGFSINLLTLFALVLAIGIVVDNAIVVVEAVHVKMHEGLSPKDATLAAMKEISGAIVAITLVMSAVFVPVAFMSGPVGVFYRQFSLTLAFAIVISGVNALTLTPALCAIILKPIHGDDHNSKGWLLRFFRSFNKKYDAISAAHLSFTRKVISRNIITVLLFVFFVAATWGTNKFLPTGFIPTEDQGMIYVNVTTPTGATVERTEHVMDQIQRIAKKIDGVESISTLAGYSLMTESAGATYGMGMIDLKRWDEREGSVWDIIRELEQKTASIRDATIQFFPPPTLPGFGNASGFELRLLDRTGRGDLKNTAVVAQKFVDAVNNRPEVDGAFTGFNANFPQYLIHIDQEMAAQKGITIENAMNNLQALIGSLYATNFIRFGQLYKVMVQADAHYRAQPEDLLKLYVKNDQGEMVPYESFVKLERVYGPEQITRYNMYTAAMINGDAAPGYSSGDVINAIHDVAAQELPNGFTYEWAGMTREEILSGNQAFFIFIVCLAFVYLLLAAQYESFLLPLAVILSLPAGLFGAFLFLKITGLQNNIYAQVALVMLIGLLGKNAILIVEFAILKMKSGYSVIDAALEGSLARLRPILMTSFAFIAGLIPLCIASGAGAIGNRSIGTAAFGGMLFGTAFGLILVPGLFVIFAGLAEKINSKKNHNKKTHEYDNPVNH